MMMISFRAVSSRRRSGLAPHKRKNWSGVRPADSALMTSLKEFGVSTVSGTRAINATFRNSIADFRILGFGEPPIKPVPKFEFRQFAISKSDLRSLRAGNTARAHHAVPSSSRVDVNAELVQGAHRDVVDHVVECLRMVVKGRHGRNNHDAHPGQLQHIFQMDSVEGR